MYEAADAGNSFYSSDVTKMSVGVLFAVGDILPSSKFAEAGTGLSTGYDRPLGEDLSGGQRAWRGGFATVETLLWATGSSDVLQSSAAAAIEVRFFALTGGRLRLGLFSKGELLGLLEGRTLSREALQSALGQRLELGVERFAAESQGAAAEEAFTQFVTRRGLTPGFFRMQRVAAAGPMGGVVPLSVSTGVTDPLVVLNRLEAAEAVGAVPRSSLYFEERILGDLGKYGMLRGKLGLTDTRFATLNEMLTIEASGSVPIREYFVPSSLTGAGRLFPDIAAVVQRGQPPSELIQLIRVSRLAEELEKVKLLQRAYPGVPIRLVIVQE